MAKRATEKKRQKRELDRQLGRSVTLSTRLALTIGSLALILLAAIAVLSTRGDASAICEAARVAASNGNPITLVIYGDFQCRRCQALHRILDPLRANPSVEVVLRHYPRDPSCNRSLRAGGHVHSGACLQARAAICAAEQGRQDEFNARLFDDGPKGRGRLVDLGAALGLDAARFLECLASEGSQRRLDEDIEAAIAKGVSGIPSVFIDDQRHIRRITAEDLACLRRHLGSKTPAATRKRTREVRRRRHRNSGHEITAKT